MKELIKPLVWKEGDGIMTATPTDRMCYTVEATEGGYSFNVQLHGADGVSVDTGELAISLAESVHEGLVLSLIKSVKPLEWTRVATENQSGVHDPMVAVYLAETPFESYAIEVYEEGQIYLIDTVEDALVESVEQGMEEAFENHLSRLISCFE